MILLFLDTETTGLKPATDQIIELGGLLVDLDPVTLEFKELTSFESTIALRKELDQKITRLTGITVEELSTASNLIAVQEKWLSWLEPYEDKIEAIIGHSIDFDLGFLRQENWFLPEVKIVDTLDLCRIIFADLEAINLEFLVNSLGISFTTTSSHHRSLFDTKATFYLFKIIVNRLNQLKLPQNYLDLILKNFLDLKIQFYGTSELLNLTESPFEKETTDVKLLTLNGLPLKPATNKRLENLDFNSTLKTINKLLAEPHTKKTTILLLQIGVIFYLKNLWPTKNYKIHLQRGLEDFWLLDFILDFLEKDTISTAQKIILPRMESLIWHISSISQNHLELAKIVEFSEILDFYETQNNSKNDTFKFITRSTHDFLLAAVSPFSNYAKYEYKPQTASLEENNVVQRLVNLMQQLTDFKVYLESQTNLNNQKTATIQNTFIEQLKQHILNLIDGFSWDKSYKLDVNLFNNLLTLSVDKIGFSINKHFLELKLEHPNVLFQSYLPQEFLARTKQILNLDFEIESVCDEVEFNFLDRVDINNFLEEKLFLASESAKPVVILAGINSTLKELKNQSLNSSSPEKYLVLGENGSTTKIISKIIHGFSGVVIFKINNLEQLLKTVPADKFAEVVLLNQPYFFVDNYLKNIYKRLGFDSYTGDRELKFLYLKSLQYYYYKVYGIFLNFVRGGY